jgi:hypothetical protein
MRRLSSDGSALKDRKRPHRVMPGVIGGNLWTIEWLGEDTFHGPKRNTST